MENVQSSSFFKDFRQIFGITVPVLLGYIPLGMGFGLLASQSGISVFISTFMSIFMYAGAGQYMAAGLFAAGASFSSIIITEILLNIRHIVYGLSLIGEFEGIGKCKPYLIFALTDETYSILTTAKIPQNVSKKRFYLGVSALNQIYWVTGSLLGSIIGKILQSKTSFDFGGIDFALTALFAVLFIERLRSKNKKDDFLRTDLTDTNFPSGNPSSKKNKKKKTMNDEVFACISGAAAALFAVILWRCKIIKSSSNILLIAMALGFALILIFRRKKN